MMLPKVTRLEERVVELVLGRREFSEATPLQTVASAAEVSEAMVVKVAKKLGYDGNSDLRASLAAYNRLPIVAMHEVLSLEDSAATIMQKVFRTASRRSRKPLQSWTPPASSLRRTLSTVRGRATSTASAARRRSHGMARTSSCASVCGQASMTTRT